MSLTDRMSERAGSSYAACSGQSIEPRLPTLRLNRANRELMTDHRSLGMQSPWTPKNKIARIGNLEESLWALKMPRLLLLLIKTLA